jgi:hypothetical protein
MQDSGGKQNGGGFSVCHEYYESGRNADNSNVNPVPERMIPEGRRRYAARS